MKCALSSILDPKTSYILSFVRVLSPSHLEALCHWWPNELFAIGHKKRRLSPFSYTCETSEELQDYLTPHVLFEIWNLIQYERLARIIYYTWNNFSRFFGGKYLRLKMSCRQRRPVFFMQYIMCYLTILKSRSTEELEVGDQTAI